MARGASGAECTISEGDEFSATVRMSEVETLKEAGSRGRGNPHPAWASAWDRRIRRT